MFFVSREKSYLLYFSNGVLNSLTVKWISVCLFATLSVRTDCDEISYRDILVLWAKLKRDRPNHERCSNRHFEVTFLFINGCYGMVVSTYPWLTTNKRQIDRQKSIYIYYIYVYID